MTQKVYHGPRMRAPHLDHLFFKSKPSFGLLPCLPDGVLLYSVDTS